MLRIAAWDSVSEKVAVFFKDFHSNSMNKESQMNTSMKTLVASSVAAFALVGTAVSASAAEPAMPDQQMMMQGQAQGSRAPGAMPGYGMGMMGGGMGPGYGMGQGMGMMGGGMMNMMGGGVP